MTVKAGIVKEGIIKIGGLLNGVVLQAGGVIPPPTGKIFKALDGDLFISINDKLFTSLE
jgi:hypothetical protein